MALLIYLMPVSGCYKAPLGQPLMVEELQRTIEQAGKAYKKGDSARAISLYRDALKRARLIQDDKTTLIILISLSRLLTSIEEVSEAEECITTAKRLLQRADELHSRDIPEDLKEELYLEEMRIVFLKRDIQALSHKEDFKNLLLNSKNISIKIRALNLFARIELYKEQYEEAEKYLLESLKINNISLLERANSHRLLGELYGKLKKTEAEFHLLEALRIDRELALPQKIGLDMEILGRYYRDRGEWKKARQYFQRALEIWRLKDERERISQINQLLEELKE